MTMRRLVVLAWVVAGVAACEPTAPAPADPHALAYRLTWSLAGTSPIAGSDGFEVTTADGLRVRTTRGWVVTETVAFLECHPEELTARGPATHPALGLLTTALLGPRFAEAGHELARMNPARLAAPQVESLVPAQTLDAGSVSPPPARYCNVHYLIARAAGDARGLPADVDMLGASFQVEGTWQAAAGNPWKPFRIRTNAANGVVDALRSSEGAPTFVADTAVTGATATVRRSLATLYDGVDFAGSSETAQAWQILKNLIASTEISVEPAR